MKYPIGKGIFVWRLELCAGGDPVRLAAEAAMQGFAWVVLKVVEARWRYQPALLGPAIEALRDAGVGVWGYQFLYGGATLNYPTN